MMAKANSNTKADEIYKEAMKQLTKKISEDMELVGLEPEDVIQYLNFKRIQKLEEQTTKLEAQNIKLDEQNELLRSEVGTLRTDMKSKERTTKCYCYRDNL